MSDYSEGDRGTGRIRAVARPTCLGARLGQQSGARCLVPDVAGHEFRFVVNGAPVPHNSALTSLGAEMHLTQRWMLLGKFDGEFASSSQIYAGSGTLRYQW